MAHLPQRTAGRAAIAAVSLLAFAAACGRGTPPASAPAGGDGRSSAATEGRALTAEEFGGTPVTRAEELFEGRFPGVRVLRNAAGGISVRIRGTTSILGSNEPLYVIDGVPITPGPGGALFGINPRDIARIEVLRDVSSTAFYGIRGANGVVLITTKR